MKYPALLCVHMEQVTIYTHVNQLFGEEFINGGAYKGYS